MRPMNRRDFMAESITSAALLATPRVVAGPALIAITLDLEMSRHYPTWDQTHWDYEKGNLDDATKRYSLEAARRVKERGGRIHFFGLGRTLEQGDVGWLEQLVHEGHSLGNHTYDHVNVLATRAEDLQFRFKRSPWLIAGKTTRQVIAENIQLTAAAMKTRLGVAPAGFRTPGGFHGGLKDREDVQKLLLDLGHGWVSSLYPSHPMSDPGVAPTGEIIRGIAASQERAQPFTYPTGLVEVPMSPISDVTAFRSGKWPLDAFLWAIRESIEWVVARGAVFDFLAHPSCLVITDPDFRSIELIADLAVEAGSRARLVNLEEIAASDRVGGRGPM